MKIITKIRNGVVESVTNERGEPVMPHPGRVALNAGKAVLRNAGAFLRGYKLFTDSETRAVRDCVCAVCPFFNRSKKRCSFCGCKERWKTSLDAEACPKGFW